MRRARADLILAVLLPLLCAAALGLTRPDRDPGVSDHAPTTAPLSTASVVCPSSLGGTDDQVGVSTLASGSARGKVLAGSDQLDVRAHRVATAPAGSDPAVLTGTGAVAPALVAGRSSAKPLAALDCPPTAGDQWFTGVGAGPAHDSVLELVNPNSGPAQADVSVWSAQQPIEVDALRGVAVPGGSSTRLDLGTIVPRQGDLTLRVHTDRGQLSATVSDKTTDLATGAVSQDWLPAQAAPATSSLLLGLASGAGERTLDIANAGADEVRATVKVVTADSVFAPAGLEPIRVPPGSTASVSLADLLEQAVGQGAIGLQVSSTGPVTVGLRQVVGGDLADLAPVPALTDTSGLVVPAGTKRLLLAGPSGVGVATVTAYAADGKRLAGQDVELKPDSGADVALPDGAALVTVTPERTTVGATVLVSGPAGIAALSFRELPRTGLVPDVRPGLP